MALQIQGFSGVIGEVGGTAYRALRVENRPLDVGSLGAYRIAMQTGVMAAGLAANSEIFQFRWTDATRICVIEKIQFDGAGSIVAFAAGTAIFRLTPARAFSAAGSGGTAATITGNNQKLRTTMGSTLLGEARCASTAALGAGTKTLDAQDIGAAVGSFTAVAGVSISPQPFMDVYAGGHPLVLVQNEGFVIRAAVPATGTWSAGITVHWTEMAAY